MNNTIRIAKGQIEAFELEAALMGIQWINLGDVDGDTRIMLDTSDLLDAYSLGYVMGVTTMTERVKRMIRE